jgi:hypothetical protein
MFPVLEFWNNLWGLRIGLSYRSARLQTVVHRQAESIFGIDSWDSKDLKIHLTTNNHATDIVLSLFHFFLYKIQYHREKMCAFIPDPGGVRGDLSFLLFQSDFPTEKEDLSPPLPVLHSCQQKAGKTFPSSPEKESFSFLFGTYMVWYIECVYGTLIKKIKKFSSYIRKLRVIGCKVICD